MNGGDSATDLVLFEELGGTYARIGAVSVPGGEDAEFFRINDRAFLATASVRTGRGPYEYHTESQIFRWDGDRFVPFQSIPTFAAKQWRHWTVGERHFLGLAQGVEPPGVEVEHRPSLILEWDGERFVAFQEIPSRWAYNWHPFELDGTTWVAHADHLDPSVLYRFDGERYVAHQELAPSAGRAFASFVADGAMHLFVACLTEPSRLLRWDGGRFVELQRFEDLGGREVAVLRHDDELLLVRVNFIRGSRAEPDPSLDSTIYRWKRGRLEIAATFPTSGGTDVALVQDGEAVTMVISNALSSDVRFATDSVVYRITGG